MTSNCTDATITYSIKSNDSISLVPSFITFSTATMIINCNPTLSLNVGQYNVSIIGTINIPNSYGPMINSSIPISKTIYFSIVVVDNYCNETSLVVTPPEITNMNY